MNSGGTERTSGTITRMRSYFSARIMAASPLHSKKRFVSKTITPRNLHIMAVICSIWHRKKDVNIDGDIRYLSALRSTVLSCCVTAHLICHKTLYFIVTMLRNLTIGCIKTIVLAKIIMIKTIESHHGSVNTTANMVRIYWVHSTKSSIMTLLSIL